MDTPTYTATVVVGGQNQTTQFGGAFPEPTGFDENVIITRQSGTFIVTFVDANNNPFDISGLSGTDAKVVPFGSAVAPTTLGTGVVSGAGNNIYTVTWPKDTIPANYSTFPQDVGGAIALLIELDETGDDYFQAYTRFNVTDGDLSGDATAAPVGGFDFTYNPANSVDWSKFGQGTPASVNTALDTLAQAGKTDWGQVINLTEVTAPASPTNGDRYVIAGIGGDWSTATIGDIAMSDGTTWTFKTPIEGDEVYDNDTQDRYRYTGAAWIISDGDVVGPSSAVDSNLCVFDTTTGKLIKDSGVGVSELYKENLIIDGQFNHWDEGAGPFTASDYTATMWLLDYTGSGAGLQRNAFTVGQTDVPHNPKYYASNANEATATTTAMQQRIFNVAKTASKTYTFSCWLKGSASGTVGLRFVQNFGTGGSPSSDVTISDTSVGITTSWAKYSVTISVPSISGKTLGTNDDSYTLVSIDQKGNSGTFEGTLDMANIALVEGSEVYGQDFLTAGDERHRIDEFYQIIGDYEEGVAGSNVIPLFPVLADATTQYRISVYFRRKMISSPSMTFATPNTGSINSSIPKRTSVRIDSTVPSSASAQVFSHLIADARL